MEVLDGLFQLGVQKTSTLVRTPVEKNGSIGEVQNEKGIASNIQPTFRMIQHLLKKRAFVLVYVKD